MRRSNLLCALPVLASLLVASPSQARRVAIDSVGTVETQGYCDLNGDDCDAPLVLPFFVDFGSGFTNLAYVHGNGILSFGAPIDFSTYSDGFGGYNLPNSLSDYSGTVFGGPLNNSYDFNFFDPDPIRSQQNVFLRAGMASFQNNVITATWFGCTGPSNCFIAPNSITMTAQSDGFLVSVDGSSFLAPAKFRFASTSVPEPSAWLLMLAGFGLAGTALRRDRKAKRTAIA